MLDWLVKKESSTEREIEPKAVLVDDIFDTAHSFPAGIEIS